MAGTGAKRSGGEGCVRVSALARRLTSGAGSSPSPLSPAEQLGDKEKFDLITGPRCLPRGRFEEVFHVVILCVPLRLLSPGPSQEFKGLHQGCPVAPPASLPSFADEGALGRTELSPFPASMLYFYVCLWAKLTLGGRSSASCWTTACVPVLSRALFTLSFQRSLKGENLQLLFCPWDMKTQGYIVPEIITVLVNKEL